MTILKSPIRSTTRSPLRGALESAFGGVPNPLSISAPSFSILTSAQPHDFSAANSNEVTASDADAGGGDFTWTVAATGDGAPTITLAGTAGLVFSVGDGTADASMTFVCTVAEFNTAMDGATLQGGTNGSTSIAYSMTDGTNTANRTQIVNTYAALDIDTYLPVDNATDIVDHDDIVATFSRQIQFGTGNVVLFDVTGAAAQETFDVSTAVDGVVTGSPNGYTLTISGADLTVSTEGQHMTGSNEYAMQIAATAVDGALLGTSDSFAGITGTTAWSWTTGEDLTLAITEFDDGFIFQRSAGTDLRTINVAGTYSGLQAPTAIQVRVLDSIDATVVDWVTVDASPAGGTWSGSVLNVPTGGPYHLEARDTVETTPESVTANDFFVGAVVIVYGQSNAEDMKTEGTAPTPSIGTGWWDPVAGAFDKTPEGIGLGTLANEIVRLTGIPCGIIHHHEGGNKIEDLDTGSTAYGVLTGYIDAYDDDAESIMWMQGESDAGPTSLATYRTLLKALHDDLAAHVGRTTTQIPFLIGGLFRYTAGGGLATSDQWGAFIDNQQKIADDNADIYFSHSGVDIPLIDGLHGTAPGFETVGERFAYTYAFLQGDETSEASFFLDTECTIIDGTTTRIDVVHGSGTDFTFDAASTGFEVWDGVSAWVGAVGARIDANTIELTHGGLGGPRKVAYMRGDAPA